MAALPFASNSLLVVKQFLPQVTLPAIFWIVALAFMHGLIYLLIIPPWQHYDEPAHFLRAAQVAGLAPAGIADPRLGRVVADSMYQHAFFPPEVRPDLINFSPAILGLDQQVHPAFYYALVAGPMHLLAPFGVEAQLYAVRMISLLLFVLTICIVWRITTLIIPDEPLIHWIIPLLLLLSPPFVDLMTAVNNDVLVNFAGAAVFLGCVLLIRDGLRPVGLAILGLSLLIALLTKRTGLPLLVPTSLALLWAAWRTPIRWWRMAALLGAGALVVLLASIRPAEGRWTSAAWLNTLDQRYLRLDIARFIQSITNPAIDPWIYVVAVRLIFGSYWTQLSWGQIQLGVWVEGIAALIALAATVGVGLRLWQLRTDLPHWQWRILWLFVLSVVLAWVVAILRLHPIPTDGSGYLPRGRYMFWAALPLIWLLALGVQGVVPARWRPYSLYVLLGGFVVLSVIALVTVVRYYA